MDDNQNDQIQEGEIVANDTQEVDQASQAMVLESLESMIRENLIKISKLQQELNTQKEMLDSVLQNDETYKQHDEAVKAAQKVKGNTKKEILKRPDVAQVDAKIKSLSAEIKEAKESLYSYLPEYQRLSGSNEINDENGEPMQIILKASLIRRRP